MVKQHSFNRKQQVGFTNSATQQDWTSLGADLQQELRQQWIPNQPLQVKCAVRDGALLVLAEHLLHVEPNPGETFASLEREIRRLVPELLSLQKTTALQPPSELPVQLFLRIAGYQQPYNSHKFQLDFRRSPIAESATQRFSPLVGPTVRPAPLPTVPSPNVEAEEDVTPDTPAKPIAADEPQIEPPEAVLAPDPVVPEIDPLSATIPIAPLTDAEDLTEERLERTTIETPEAEAPVEPIEPATESITANLESTTVNLGSIDAPEAVELIEPSPIAEAESPEATPVLESAAIDPEAIASSPDTIPSEVAAPEVAAPEPLSFEDLFSGESTEEPAATEMPPPEVSIDRSTELPEETSNLPPTDIAVETALISAEIPSETAEPSPVLAEAVFAETVEETTETAAIETVEPSLTPEAPLESAEASLEATEPTDLQEEAQLDFDQSTLDEIEPLQTSAIETSAIAPPAAESVELSESVEPVETAEPTATSEVIDHSEPIEFAEPIESTEPIEPNQPIETVEPIATIETAEQSEVVELAETVELVNPVESIESIATPEITETTEPIEFVESIEETEHSDTVAFVAPIEIPPEVESVEPIELTELIELSDPIESIEPTSAIETTEPIEFVEPIEEIERSEPIEFAEPIEIAEEIESAKSIEIAQEAAAEPSIEPLTPNEAASLPFDQVAQLDPVTDAIQADNLITAEPIEPEPVEPEPLQLLENDSPPQIDPLANINLTGTIWPEPELQDLDVADPADRDLQIDADWTATETSPDLLEEIETAVETPEISEIPEMTGVIDLDERDTDRPVEQPIEPQLDSAFSPTGLPDPWAAESSTIDEELAEPSSTQPDDLTHSDLHLADQIDDADLQIDSTELLSEAVLPEDSIELDNLETIGDLTEEQTVWAESDGLPEDSPEIDSLETTESLTEEQTVWAESDSLPEDSIETDSIDTLSMSEDPMAAALVEEQAETIADIQPSSPPLPTDAATPDLSHSSALLPESPIDRPQQAATAVDGAEPKTRRPFRWSASSMTLVGAIGAFVAVGTGYLLTRPCVIGECEPLRKAQQLSQEAIETASTTDSALEISDAYKKLNEANYLLSTIPNWSRYRQEAETLLKSYEDQAIVLSQVVEALEQANQAAQKSQNPPHPLQEWREIQWLWRESIARLEKIPPTNPLYDLAQRKQQEYQTNLTGINQRVAIEQQAQDRITAARQIEQLGNARALAAKSPTNWQETASTWTTAIGQLRQIPQGTMAYDEAQQLIAIYQPKLTEANLKRAQEQTAVDVYSQALNAAKQAQTMEQQSQWIQAATYWQNALSYAQQVPIESTYYNQIQTLIGSYRQSLQQAQQNSQRAVAIQAVKPSLDQACEGSPRLCTYTLSPQAIRVQFTAMYDKTVETLINKTQLESGNSIPTAIVDQVNSMLRSLADVGEVTQVPIELYDSRGVKLGIYTPSLSGYVPQQ